jgi:NADH:ubiquinone oxidoreductase subunit
LPPMTSRGWPSSESCAGQRQNSRVLFEGIPTSSPFPPAWSQWLEMVSGGFIDLES